MQGGGAICVEEEGWVSGWRWEGGEVDGFLGPLRGVGGGGIGGFPPVGEAGIVVWVDV